MEVKAGYKQTEVGIVPSDWNIKPCTSLSDLITVGIVIRPAQYYVKQGVPALRSANIREDGINDIDMVFISEKANRLLSKSQVRVGDLLTVRTGYPGTTAVVPPSFAGSNCIDLLIMRPSKDVNSKYLSYWINSSHGKDQVLRNQGGLAQQHFNVGELRNLLVALPPTLAEQQAIAEALSDADALLTSLDALIAMQELLTGKKRLPGFSGGWKKYVLSDIGSFSKGRGIKKDEVVSDGIPCIRYGEIYTHYDDYIRRFYSFISPRTAKQSQRIKKGDLLFTGSGETAEGIGKCVAFLGDEEVYAGGDVVIFSPVDQNSMYLGYLMNHSSMVIQKARMAQGDAIVHISAQKIGQLRLLLPNIVEQTAIAEILSDMDAEIAAIEQKREKTRLLKQGMMQELLTGRIRLV